MEFGVSSKNETTTLYGLPGDDVIDNEDIVAPLATDWNAKGDVVLVVQYGGRTYVEEPKTVTGEMEALQRQEQGRQQELHQGRRRGVRTGRPQV